MKTKQQAKKKRPSPSQKLNGEISANSSATASPSRDFILQWKARHAELEKKHQDLRHELAKLLEERDAHVNSLRAVLPVYEGDFDEEAALAQVGKGQSFEELIEELRQEKPLEEMLANKKAKTRGRRK